MRTLHGSKRATRDVDGGQDTTGQFIIIWRASMMASESK